MSHPEDARRNDHHEQAGATERGRRRGRILIPLVVLLIIAVIFTYILVVGTSNDEADEVSAPALTPVVATAPA